MAREREDVINEIVASFRFEDVKEYLDLKGIDWDEEGSGVELSELREAARQVLKASLNLEELSAYYSEDGMHKNDYRGFVVVVSFTPNKKKKITMDDITEVELHYSLTSAVAYDTVWED